MNFEKYEECTCFDGCCLDQEPDFDFVLLVLDPEEADGYADVLEGVDHVNWTLSEDEFKLSLGMKFGPDRDAFFPGCTIKVVMLDGDGEYSVITFKDCTILNSSFGVDNSEEKQLEYFNFSGKEHEVSFITPDEPDEEVEEKVEDAT
mgnify:CR=1 FL=1